MVTDDAAQLHTPVLLQRCCDLLAPAIEGRSHAVVIDATLGLGGHSEELLRRFANVTVVGFDQDATAVEKAGLRLASFGERMIIEHSRNDQITSALAKHGISEVNGALFDLGVSSMQLDIAQRGFAYAIDAPLDMRMDARSPVTAAHILNTWDAAQIAQVLRDYSGEKFARSIAKAVVRQRALRPFETSAQLVELIYDVIPAPARRTGGHPAKRTFQALRIAVNDELGSLRRALPQALEATVVGGRVVVMSYQSGEDTIVKAEFARRCKVDVPARLPVTADKLQAPWALLTRGAEQASDAEIAENPRAASVRLRAIERRAA